MEHLGERLRQAREEFGLTQAAAARLAKVGRTTLNRWECDKRPASLDHVRRYLATLSGHDDHPLAIELERTVIAEGLRRLRCDRIADKVLAGDTAPTPSAVQVASWPPHDVHPDPEDFEAEWRRGSRFCDYTLESVEIEGRIDTDGVLALQTTYRGAQIREGAEVAALEHVAQAMPAKGLASVAPIILRPLDLDLVASSELATPHPEQAPGLERRRELIHARSGPLTSAIGPIDYRIEQSFPAYRKDGPEGPRGQFAFACVHRMSGISIDIRFPLSMDPAELMPRCWTGYCASPERQIDWQADVCRSYLWERTPARGQLAVRKPLVGFTYGMEW